MHVDLMRVSEKTRINVDVPMQFLNEETCPGLKAGGVLNVVRHTVEVICPATAIPEALEADLSSAEVGDAIHISAVNLPAGVELTVTDRDFTIATIAAPSAMRSEESEDDADGDVAPDEVPATEQSDDGEGDND